jgi:hypothetical protein
MISGMELLFKDDSKNGTLTIAMAGTDPLDTDKVLALVTFHAIVSSGNTTTNLTVDKFLANESNMSAGSINGSITITGDVTGLPADIQNMCGLLLPVYPNPSSDNTMVSYQLNGENQKVQIEVFNLMGQKVVTLVNETNVKGKYSVPVLKQGSQLEPGSYLIRLTVDGVSQSQIFQIVR